MFRDAITGLRFRIILGLVGIKSKNCYVTILLHDAMNVFGK